MDDPTLTPAELEEARELYTAATAEFDPEAPHCACCVETLPLGDEDLDPSPVCDVCAQKIAERLGYFFPRVLETLAAKEAEIAFLRAMFPKPGDRCSRCHHTAPNENGCQACNTPRLAERLTETILDANELRSKIARLETEAEKARKRQADEIINANLERDLAKKYADNLFEKLSKLEERLQAERRELGGKEPSDG